MKHKIAIIPGDGIGPEVIAEGIKILKCISDFNPEIQFQLQEFPWGCEYYLKNGRMMAEDGIATLSSFDAIYLGACRVSRSARSHITLGPLVSNTQEF